MHSSTGIANLEPVDLPLRKVPEQANKPIKAVYFPESRFASVVVDAGKPSGHKRSPFFPNGSRTGASMQPAIKRSAQNVGESFSSAAEGVSSAARSARDQAAAAAGAVSDAIGEYSEKIGDQASEMAEQAQEQLGAASEEVIRRIRKLVEEQPLLVGAIGLAIGAGIAAVVPTTEAEKEYLSESSEAAKEAVSEFASEQLETAKDAAGKVAQAMSEAADTEGLTEEVQSFGDSVSKQLGKVAQAGADRARESLQSDKKT